MNIENTLIYVLYIFAIPAILYSLIKPILSVVVRIDGISLRKKNKVRYQPILWLDFYPSYHHGQKRTSKNNRNKKRNFKKPQPLYHLTTRGRIYIGTKIMLLCISEVCGSIKQWIQDEVLHVYKQWINTIEQSINAKINRIFTINILRHMRMILYAMLAMKVTKTEVLKNGTSTMSTIFLFGIIFGMIVTVMESKPVDAVKMSPQEKAHKRNMQKRQKRAMESPQEQTQRRASQRERAAANKEANNKKRRVARSEENPDQDETRRTSQRIEKQQQRDKSRRRKNFSQLVKVLMQNAARALQMTNVDQTRATNREHRSQVCLICDCFLMGSYPNGVPSMSIEEIKQHRDRLGVQSYEEYYGITLKESLKKEYTVTGFEDMLLSTRSRKVSRGRYAVCKECKCGMKKEHINKKSPPKFSIANGNVIGTFPTRIPCCMPGKERQHRTIAEEDLNPVLKAFMSPVRPFGYVFQHHGGKQKCISGHYQFFETDQNCVTGALNYMNKNIADNVFVMICGATTPRQNQSIIAKTSVDIELFKDIRTWFVNNSSCRAFKDEPLPSNIEELTPVVIRDSIDACEEEEVEPVLENTFGGVTYAFSSAQNPMQESSVFQTSKKFACAMVKQTNPILMLHGGNYAREHEVDIEAVLPFAFPYGIWVDRIKKGDPGYQRIKSSNGTQGWPCLSL